MRARGPATRCRYGFTDTRTAGVPPARRTASRRGTWARSPTEHEDQAVRRRRCRPRRGMKRGEAMERWRATVMPAKPRPGAVIVQDDRFDVTDVGRHNLCSSYTTDRTGAARYSVLAGRPDPSSNGLRSAVLA